MLVDPWPQLGGDMFNSDWLDNVYGWQEICLVKASQPLNQMSILLSLLTNIGRRIYAPEYDLFNLYKWLQVVAYILITHVDYIVV